MNTPPSRFVNIGFEDFKELARDERLSKYERIGFPDAYRQGHEEAIFLDIRRKLNQLDDSGRVVVDIGPGCSDLPRMLIDHCRNRSHQLTLIDSEEMLRLLPEADDVTRLAGRFPDRVDGLDSLAGRVDVLLCYSVLHYVLVDVAFFRFLDTALSLLAPGGQFLIGDIPNISKRKRFFASETGIAFHRRFMQTDDAPEVQHLRIEHDQIDDAVVFALVQRARAAGFDAYVLPQDASLPMANRREDILIVRP
jgi:hypothetical protein